MAVERVLEGARPSEVIASYGFHRCTIYRWLKPACGRGQGLKALGARPAIRRAPEPGFAVLARQGLTPQKPTVRLPTQS